ncbi:NAD(P)H-dependent oxidoreductase [[Brevibacterium] frigoritolerans]|uniref:NAD(P)H-dependent oxidoreductase n=1 Tax=Peribacillus frigoritolerans TaxID=450367 RepID=A0A941FL41_9BACI|nr:NAD(P)H-dependent oxidoreductase [Peribacillus frigoritolerans]
MSKVLFVKSNDRPADQAISVKMYETFLNAYKEANSSDEITELDLFELNLPYYGNTAITALYKRNQGMELTEEEVEIADIVQQYLNQFLAADKVVFGLPAMERNGSGTIGNLYFYLAQAGTTFKYTAEGPVGLAGDKKWLYLMHADPIMHCLEWKLAKWLRNT